VQTTDGGGALLDAVSRALGDPAGPPDVISVSYGGCAVAEEQGAPAFVATTDAVLAMAALAGVSTFVASGDSGSTTCPQQVRGTSLSYPAVSPYVTAVGGTRLALGAQNARAGETVWNDAPYGARGAGGGGVSRTVPRPAYQDGVQGEPRRALPDVSALADIVPGWPVVLDGALQPVGGTSGATPLVAAATSLVAGSERQAGRPPLGLVNPWLYGPAARGAFFDVVTGSNDLAGVGCCTAAPGYDPASGLGVPDWTALPGTLPAPA
jgi:subtilase family serine protease